VVKGAKHPYAALLLIDYILSREGQEILHSADYFPADPTVADVADAGFDHPAACWRAGEFLSVPTSSPK